MYLISKHFVKLHLFLRVSLLHFNKCLVKLYKIIALILLFLYVSFTRASTSSSYFFIVFSFTSYFITCTTGIIVNFASIIQNILGFRANPPTFRAIWFKILKFLLLIAELCSDYWFINTRVCSCSFIFIFANFSNLRLLFWCYYRKRWFMLNFCVVFKRGSFYFGC